MMSRLFLVFATATTVMLSAGCLGGGSAVDLSWQSMFDGQSLDNWEPKNGYAKYRISDGAIVGQTAEGSPNSFLCSKQTYGDFEMTFEVKVDNQLNSGVQIRSQSKADFKDGRVHGPQVEIEAAPGEAGHIYSEGTGRGWISSEEARANPKARVAFKNGDWNTYRVVAQGARIRTWVNGIPVADIRDEESPREGFIGLQVHGIKRGAGPYEVRWRNLKIRNLAKPDSK